MAALPQSEDIGAFGLGFVGLAGMVSKRVDVRDARVLVLGLTSRENTPDLRNTCVVDIVEHLQGFGATVDVHDHWADADEAQEERGIDLVAEPVEGAHQGVQLAVAHDSFCEMGPERLLSCGDPDGHAAVYDLKGLLARESVDGRL